MVGVGRSRAQTPRESGGGVGWGGGQTPSTRLHLPSAQILGGGGGGGGGG